MRATFWYTHRELGIKARMIHAHANELPTDIGHFDVVVLAAVLLHTRNPHDIIEQCARLAKTIIIVEPFYADLENKGPLIRFHPKVRDRVDLFTWWHFSTSFMCEYLRILGFDRLRIGKHDQRDLQAGRAADMFTLIASRSA
jgi:O-methyltransferase